jgi:Flp pilus assembly protein TadD
MSLLMKALQQAAQNREQQGEAREATLAGGGPEPDPARALELEPLDGRGAQPAAAQPAPAAPVAGGSRFGPTPAARAGPAGGARDAAAVLSAGARPGFAERRGGGLSQRTRIALIAGTGSVMLGGWATYVYLQIAHPGLFHPSAQGPLSATRPPPAAPLPPAAAPVDPAPPAGAALAGAGAPETMRPPAQARAEAPAITGAGVPATKAVPAVPAASATMRPPAAGADPQPAVDAVPVPRPPETVAAAEGARAARPRTPAVEAQRPEAAERAPVAAAPAPAAEAIRVLPGGPPAPVDPQLLAARQALFAGRTGEAQQIYRRLLATEPRNVAALLGLGSALQLGGDADGALRLYLRVLELEPRHALAQTAVIGLAGRADPLAAESQLKQLLSREPSAFLHFTLGNLYADQGRWPAAQQAWFQAHALEPANPDYAFNLALGLERMAQLRLAADFYRRALELAAASGRAGFDPAAVRERVRLLEAAQ